MTGTVSNATHTALESDAATALRLNPTILGPNGCVAYAWRLEVSGGVRATVQGFADSIVEAEAEIAAYQARDPWARSYPECCSAPAFADNRDPGSACHQEYTMAGLLEQGLAA